MKRGLLVLGLGLGLGSNWGGGSPIAFAGDPTPNLDTNPYIELYKLRIAQAEANLRRQVALSTLGNARLERGRKLIEKRVISMEEYDTIVSDAAVSVADVDLASKKVEESRAYFRVVEALVKRGVSIPLCTYEME